MCVISIIYSLLTYFWLKTTHPYLHALFFPIPCPAALGEVVDRCKLNQGREDKGIAHRHEPVHGGGIGHLREGVSSTDAQGGHGEHSGDPWGWKENIRYVDENTWFTVSKAKVIFLFLQLFSIAVFLKSRGVCVWTPPQIHYTYGNMQERWLQKLFAAKLRN